MMVTERKLTVPPSTAPKKIAKIQFGMLGTEEIKLAAQIRVSNREIYQMPQRSAAPFGCMDSKLGISDKMSACKTCG
jgi:DNA-directed RNA polymerase beta' subunit